MSRPPRRSGLAAALALLCLGLFAPAVALAAEGERVLEPRLSLTGGCGTTAVDPIPDPGLCPLEKEGGPGVPGVDHPPNTFSDPRAVATDEFGNIYVSSFGGGSKGRVDVFCSDGTYISELAVEGATSVAIDSEGYLYVYAKTSIGEGKVLHYAPDAGYQPQACEIAYGETAAVMVTTSGAEYSGIAINRDNDHLFVAFGSNPGVVEYKSAAEGNEELRTGPGPVWGDAGGMAVDAQRDRMYVSAGPSEERIDIYDLGTLVGTPPNDWYKKESDSILPSSVPANDFGTRLSVAVDEGNGNVFLLDGENCRLYEFEEDGAYVQTIAAKFLQCITPKQIAVDNGATSPNGQVSEEDEEGRFLYAPSDRTGIGHAYAFFLSTVGPPKVESVAAANISEDGVELRAQIDPNNLPTDYAFEYKVEGAPGWTPAGGGTLLTGSDPVAVAAAVTGLMQGTKYVFRVTASNEEADPLNGGQDEAEGAFSTYPSIPAETSPCANALLRTDPSALLPDCRAYELVTPGNTNSRAPIGVGRLGGVFPTRQVSPAGDKVGFRVEGGSLPGIEGGLGSLVGDPYLSTRTSTGWSTAFTGPSADEASQIAAGARSPDQGHFFYLAGDKGSAVLVQNTGYVRYPDGHSELIGQGSLGIDPEAAGQLIGDGGGHIVFSTGIVATAVQLEPEAAPSGTQAIYDRTPDGTTHVVSLKPGEEPLGAGEDAGYRGASLDGIGIAFEVDGTLYLRYDNEETFLIGTGVDVAGVAEGGKRVYYLQGGDLRAFDVEAGVIDFTTTGDAVPVTVSADGTTAYFASETAIAESGPNPEGAGPQAGEQNLYRSVEGQVDFLATVTERDVEGAHNGIELTDGLGLWTDAASVGGLGRVPARSTADGQALLFKSRAALTGYDPEGHAQIYRYAPGELQCLSCNPTGAPASSDATLQTDFREGAAALFSPFGWPENLRADGRRAFFESSEALVAGDSDGLKDVYEWEDQGVGSCTRPGGCLYLISSPKSQRGEYLWAVSPSGRDVFFLSSELLVGSDADETPSIYDARVGGGFAEPQVAAECLGEACQPSVNAPGQSSLSSSVFIGPGNVSSNPATARCARGLRQARRLSAHAKRLRRGARRAPNPRAQRRMRTRGAREARRARTLSKRAKRCRARQIGRAGR